VRKNLSLAAAAVSLLACSCGEQYGSDRMPTPPPLILGATVGVPWAPNQEGYGGVRPDAIFNGGDSSGSITKIQWSSWGRAQAIGQGTALYIPPSATSAADGRLEQATVVAYDLGPCAGATRYRGIDWYFPQEGERFEPNESYNICKPFS
jgi:hypothetical protein